MLNIDQTELYTPLPRQKSFHMSPAKFRAYIGGFGSGKSMCGCWEGIDLSLESPGVLGVICRNTYPELRDTTMRTFFEVCPEELIYNFNKTAHIVTLINGSQIFFRSLDSPEKFKSLEIGWFFIDEASDTPEEPFLILSGRLRNKNAKRLCGFITSNPSSVRHWLYKRFVEHSDMEFKYELFKAPTGENIHLPDEYEQTLRSIYDDAWVDRYVNGEFGNIPDGKPVYPEFKRALHVSKAELDPNLPVLRCWDFGFHRPACLICQKEDETLYIIDEVMGDGVLIQDFGEEVLQRCNDNYSKFKPYYMDYCDPAGNQRNDKDPRTSVQILNGLGVYPKSRQQYILDGLQIVRMLLHQKKILINERCVTIIEGLSGGYHYPKKYEGEGEDPKPFKDNYYDHLQDCLRYLVGNQPDYRSWIKPTLAKQSDYGSFSYWKRQKSKR